MVASVGDLSVTVIGRRAAAGSAARGSEAGSIALCAGPLRLPWNRETIRIRLRNTAVRMGLSSCLCTYIRQ